MTKNKKVTVEFAPGAFDHFDGTQEELDELVAEIQKLADSGELAEGGRTLDEDDWDDLPDEVKESIMQGIDSVLGPKSKRKLQ